MPAPQRALSLVDSAIAIDLMRLPTHFEISLSQLETRLVGHTTRMRLQARRFEGSQFDRVGEGTESSAASGAPRSRNALHALPQARQHQRDALQRLPETHVICEDAAEPPVGLEAVHAVPDELEPLALVLTQDAAEDGVDLNRGAAALKVRGRLPQN